MAITYKTVFVLSNGKEIKTPILHRVNIMRNVRVHDWIIKEPEIREWCKENCTGPFYMSPSYMPTKFVEFEDDEDAVIFSLKYRMI